jgi:hypothetical protein
MNKIAFISENKITTRHVSDARMGVRGKKGTLKGLKMKGYFFLKAIIEILEQKSTKR